MKKIGWRRRRKDRRWGEELARKLFGSGKSHSPIASERGQKEEFSEMALEPARRMREIAGKMAQNRRAAVLRSRFVKVRRVGGNINF